MNLKVWQLFMRQNQPGNLEHSLVKVGIERDLIKRRSLSGFVNRGFAVFVSVLFLSEALAAIALATSVKKIAQQPETSSVNSNRSAAYAKGNQLLNRGQKLFKQGTAESRQQAILEYQEALKIWRYYRRSLF